ncbi:glycosyltransferase family protein, partial [Eudoraea sp.]|uniref:glycosyltransferase family protein n=1 Tax=Eudoraea sp. TaxID=1979955 RepID=UPI003C70844E
THDGEEAQVLDAHKKLLEGRKDLLLVLVPRHPERFSAVRELAQKKGFRVVSRTEDKPCDADTQVFLCDTMGELPLFYAASDIAFVAGSLTPIGGHNLLEPAALGRPIVTGPHLFNAQEIADMFVAREACRIVADSAELAGVVAELLAHPDAAERLGKNGYDIVAANRGALQRLLVLLEPLIGQVPD